MSNVVIHKHIAGGSANQIARSVERALREGRIAPGDLLPPVRALATELGVSPTTVAAAYKALRHRGLASGEGRRGTRLAPAPPLHTRGTAPVPMDARDLATGNPDPSLLPDLRPALARIDVSHHLYADAPHLPALLELAGRQFEEDGIPADALSVVSGAMDGIERALAAHLRPGDRVGVEDPGFTAVHDLVRALGLVPVPVAVDAGGPVEAGLVAALSAGIEALIVTPRAHNPTGAVIEPSRARALRRALRAHPDVLLVEDDHAGEIAGAPVQTLWQRGHERFAAVRSVSKTLGPDLRLAVLTGDAETVARVEGRLRIGLRWVSHLLQRLVVELWTRPRVQRGLGQAEAEYARRRDALLAALAGHGIEATGRTGLNVWVPVPEESVVVQRLLDAGWAVSAGERFRIASPPAIRITTAALRPGEAPRLADAVAGALDPGSHSAIA